MLSWLAVGDHEALGRDMPRAPTITLTSGKTTIPARIYPRDRRNTTTITITAGKATIPARRDRRDITLLAAPLGGTNGLLASSW